MSKTMDMEEVTEFDRSIYLSSSVTENGSTMVEASGHLSKVLEAYARLKHL